MNFSYWIIRTALMTIFTKHFIVLFQNFSSCCLFLIADA